MVLMSARSQSVDPKSVAAGGGSMGRDSEGDSRMITLLGPGMLPASDAGSGGGDALASPHFNAFWLSRKNQRSASRAETGDRASRTARCCLIKSIVAGEWVVLHSRRKTSISLV